MTCSRGTAGAGRPQGHCGKRSPRRLRILVVAPRQPWPLNGGGRLQLHHVLRELARRADVTLALLEPPQYPAQIPAGVRSETIPRAMSAADAHRATARPAGPLARLAGRHFGFRPAVAAWLGLRATPERCDVALLASAVLGQYGPFCRVPFVWSPLDELVLPTLREAEFAGLCAWPRALHRAALYAAYERQVARRACATIFVSPLDAAYARRWVGGARLEVVPNGVDFDYFRPIDVPSEPGTIAFIGALEFPPNVDGIRHFVAHAWPMIRRQDARRRLLVVGRRPVPEVRALAGVPGVELHADVPDVRPLLARAAVVIVPTRTGGGLKNKILEGCAVRRPVVASLRALAGLTARRGRDVIAAERPATWARAIDRLLTHPEDAERVAACGHAWVRRTHHWATTGARFHAILCDAAWSAGVPDADPTNDSRRHAARLEPRRRRAPERAAACPAETGELSCL